MKMKDETKHEHLNVLDTETEPEPPQLSTLQIATFENKIEIAFNTLT